MNRWSMAGRWIMLFLVVAAVVAAYTARWNRVQLVLETRTRATADSVLAANLAKSDAQRVANQDTMKALLRELNDRVRTP